jgi:hypothetical protein
MSYVLFHFASGVRIRNYATRKGALIAMRASNRNAGFAKRYTVCEYATDHGAVREWCQGKDHAAYAPYAVIAAHDYAQFYTNTRTVKNLMTGAEVIVDANTPLCCDPSSETYWSM